MLENVKINPMLYVLFKQIRWTKSERTPENAVRRQECLEPVAVYVPPGSGAETDTAFLLKELFYVQSDDLISEVRNRRAPGGRKEMPDIGGFRSVPLDTHPIRDIGILKQDNCYQIRWFDSGAGNVRRRGGNEDFRKRGTEFCGDPYRLNETAFILREGQGGMIRWNNRFSSYHGWWYEEYRAYFVSTIRPDSNMFLRDWDFRYEQMALLH